MTEPSWRDIAALAQNPRAMREVRLLILSTGLILVVLASVAALVFILRPTEVHALATTLINVVGMFATRG